MNKQRTLENIRRYVRCLDCEDTKTCIEVSDSYFTYDINQKIEFMIQKNMGEQEIRNELR